MTWRGMSRNTQLMFFGETLGDSGWSDWRLIDLEGCSFRSSLAVA